LIQEFLDIDKIEKPVLTDYNDVHSISIFYPFLFLYKSFFSAQDIPNACLFTPTCATYAAQAIQEYGFIVGGLKTFDRLACCNHFHFEGQHEYDMYHQKYLDHP
jgi:putative component of membrane protein insertase Oxa1/YidC/SpoIIIJ protein YidD